MELDLDLEGRRALVIGGAAASRTVLARLRHAGATATLVDPKDAEHRQADAWHLMLSSIDLVLVVELSSEAETTLRSAGHGLPVWITREAPAATAAIGQVTLVGGGPGDPGLLTLAGRYALRAADVVFFDRLAPHGGHNAWAPGAEWIDVGKSPGHHAVPQHEIERLLVEAALAGRTVVRLKGGDPFVFGRGSEEVAACRAAGVPVTVISGVTSAVAVPAAAGIPVTHRELSRTFTVVSGHAPLDDATARHLVGVGGTLVVLMGVSSLPHLSATLQRQGMSADTPLAIIERGMTPDQRTTVTTLSDATETAGMLGVRSPAVIVVGEVVRLGFDADAEATTSLYDVAMMERP
ncbi:MAG TPA: uroporphyrinogen-III C-methyltransferase [Pseudolysinimonas sp.]|nr:uroporphyrinogen-III C-methyltransferase [Pseudolysinimonas sp.]